MQNNKKQCKQTQKDKIMQEMSGKGICGKMKKTGSDLLSRGQSLTIIGTEELDFRVRDGNGYSLLVMATGKKTNL